MKYFNKKLMLCSCLIFLIINHAMAGVSTLIYDFTSDLDFIATDSSAVSKNSVLRDTVAVGVSNIDVVSQTPQWLLSVRNAVINGYHKDENGLRYFSFDIDVIISGSFGEITVPKNSILKCDDVSCDNVSIYYTFDRNVQIDAFTIDLNGDIYFSVDQATVVRGLNVFPADIIRINNGLDSYTKYLDSQQAIGGFVLGVNRNIDAISNLAGTNAYLVSFKSDGCIVSCYSDSSFIIIEFGGTSDLIDVYLSTQLLGDYNNPVNISSLMFSLPIDEIFKNGFE